MFFYFLFLENSLSGTENISRKSKFLATLAGVFMWVGATEALNMKEAEGEGVWKMLGTKNRKINNYNIIVNKFFNLNYIF